MVKEWTHYFEEGDAVRFGVNAAIMLSEVRQWVRKNAIEGRNQREGRTWTFNSVAKWAKLLPFLTAKEIRNALDKLREEGVLIVGDFNKEKRDRTLWYAFADEEVWLGGVTCPDGQMAFAPGGKPSFAPGGTPLPSSHTSSLPEEPVNTPALPQPSAAAPPLAVATPVNGNHKPKTDPDQLLAQKAITNYYQKLYKLDHDGVKPAWDVKTILLVRRDLQRFGWDDVKLAGIIRDFFEDPGDFVEKRGAGMGYNVFHSQIDAMLERNARRERVQ